MAGSLTIPNRIGAQPGGNLPAIKLDSDWTAIRDYVNAREVTFGAVASRPAAGVSGRYWYGTDTRLLYADDGIAWNVAGSLGNVSAFGVSPGASASDNRANLQAAVDAVPAAGGVLVFSEYGVHIDAAITVDKPLLVLGPGTTEVTTPGTFVLYLDTASQVGWDVTAKGPFILRDFSMRLATGCTGVKLDGPAGALNGVEDARLDNVVMYGGAVHLDVVNAIFYGVYHSTFWNYTDFGVKIHNTIDPDQGDGMIDDCTFNGGVAANGIYWTGGGGLRVSSTKLLGNDYGMQFDVLATTVDIIIDDVSIENFQSGGLLITRSAGAATISHITLTAAQIAQYSGTGSGIIIGPIGVGTLVVALTIGGGSVITNLSGAAVVLREVNGGTIAGNHMDAVSVAFDMDATVLNVLVGENNYYATPAILTGTPGAGTIIRGGTIAGSGGFPIALLTDMVFDNGSQIFVSDGKNPGDAGYAFGAVAGGGTGTPSYRAGGAWVA